MAFRDLAILSLVLILAIGTPSYAASYLDSPSAIPGKIEAENYDTGGEGEGEAADKGVRTIAMLIANLPELGSLNRQEIADIKILLPLLLFAPNTDSLLLIWL